MEIQGHYQNGLIVPHNSPSLPDGTEVTIVVRDTAPPRADVMTEEQLRRYHEALSRIDAIPDENPGDNFSGADHDRVLYGEGA
jgi:predicted DNA-binding antitoxin AbrB/MazE fold protein